MSISLKKIFTLVMFTALMSAILLAAVAHAQTVTTLSNTGGAPTFVPIAPTPSTGPFANLYGTGAGNLSGFVSALFKVALSIGALAAVLRLVYAGYEYMGSDIWHKKEHAKLILGDVVLGLLLLLGAWLVLYQINPCILSLNILADFSGSVQTCSS